MLTPSSGGHPHKSVGTKSSGNGLVDTFGSIFGVVLFSGLLICCCCAVCVGFWMYKAMSGKKEKKKTQESEAEVEGEVEGRVGDGNYPSRYVRYRNGTVFWQHGFQFAILD